MKVKDLKKWIELANDDDELHVQVWVDARQPYPLTSPLTTIALDVEGGKRIVLLEGLK
ncbi:hypothetical protein [Methylobacter sp.]|uniref:hypothetical protein n=1 Tax=Methylobacter sp. TaxID=2051955 RepID=UPI0025E3161B|nr:hypothetical protein [Methylobacter sp.]